MQEKLLCLHYIIIAANFDRITKFCFHSFSSLNFERGLFYQRHFLFTFLRFCFRHVIPKYVRSMNYLSYTCILCFLFFVLIAYSLWYPVSSLRSIPNLSFILFSRWFCYAKEFKYYRCPSINTLRTRMENVTRKERERDSV